jgi:hypothetical protein
MRPIIGTRRRPGPATAAHRGAAGGNESARSAVSTLGSRSAALATAAGLTISASITLAAMASAQEYQPFDIWNLSSADLTLSSYAPMGGLSYRVPVDPSPGAVIRPGMNFHIVLIRVRTDESLGLLVRLSGRGATAGGQAQNWEISMGTYNNIYCTVGGNPPPAHQTAACGSYIGKGGNVATVADEPGYKVTIPASDAAKQDQINQDLCHNGYKAQLGIGCTDSADAMIVTAGWTTWTLQHKK